MSFTIAWSTSKFALRDDLFLVEFPFLLSLTDLDMIGYSVLKLNPVELILTSALDIYNCLGHAPAEVFLILPLVEQIVHLVRAG